MLADVVLGRLSTSVHGLNVADAHRFVSQRMMGGGVRLLGGGYC